MSVYPTNTAKARSKYIFLICWCLVHWKPRSQQKNTQSLTIQTKNRFAESCSLSSTYVLSVKPGTTTRIKTTLCRTAQTMHKHEQLNSRMTCISHIALHMQRVIGRYLNRETCGTCGAYATFKLPQTAADGIHDKRTKKSGTTSGLSWNR